MGRTTTNLAASPATAKADSETNSAPSAASACVEHAFEPRPTRFIGVREISGWRLRAYAITLPGEALDEAVFEEGVAVAGQSLPQPPAAPGRFGVGLVILHQGRGMDYIVLAWWSRENELPMRIFVRERVAGAPWRAATGEESICVWDIEVIKRERDVYVATVLSARGQPDVKAYLVAPMT